MKADKTAKDSKDLTLPCQKLKQPVSHISQESAAYNMSSRREYHSFIAYTGPKSPISPQLDKHTILDPGSYMHAAMPPPPINHIDSAFDIIPEVRLFLTIAAVFFTTYALATLTSTRPHPTTTTPSLTAT